MSLRFQRNRLIGLMRTVLNKMGGTGVDGYTIEQYIEDQMDGYATEGAIERAHACFSGLVIRTDGGGKKSIVDKPQPFLSSYPELFKK